MRRAAHSVNIVYMTRENDSFEPHRIARAAARDKVVSARMNDQLVAELDELVRRTGRSRGFYLRAALEEMLPVLKERYWAHDIESRRNELAEFNTLAQQLRDDPTSEGGKQSRG